ncbi:MAG TPA: cytochrome c oxidase subunit II [Candidatus Limnocylindrales bacterium]|nr:cytochrome c oxidase subunit II [Candidatus Limnocylindrales bacterium]
MRARDGGDHRGRGLHGRRAARALGSLAALALVAALVGGCLPAGKTAQSQAVNTLWGQFMIAAAIVGGIVWGLITIAILRYRRRPSTAGIPPQIGNVTWLEIVWTGLPILTILGLFALTLGALGTIDAVSANTAVRVDVTAFRWQWRFAYEGTPVTITGGPTTPAEMVVPVGEPIHIVLTSDDVDHSFFVPAFLFKRDAIPGHPNAFDLTITEPGSYSGQCAEFCGVFHDRMTLTVRAVTRPEFDAWLSQQQSGAPASPAPPSNSPAPEPTTSNAAAPSTAQEASQQP